VNIHYNITTGQILSWGTVDSDSATSHYAGCSVVNVAYGFIDPKADKIDPQTVKLAKWTAAEIAQALLPTTDEVARAVASELRNTDEYVLSDRDDLAPATIAAWKTYRKALRDLSKGTTPPTPAAMITAWPLDPNGNDTIPQLRNA